jgi:hypothetical protein
MAREDESTHTFVLRIWKESRELDGALPEWRGSIEHVANQERRFVRTLQDVILFIASYIEHMGIDPWKKDRS